MNKKIIDRRIRVIRRLLKESRISCFVVTKRANVTYATGFSGDDSWAIITAGGVYLLTDCRYIEQTEKQCPHCRIIERNGSMAEETAKLVCKLKSVRTVTVEKSTSLAVFDNLRKSVKVRLKSDGNIIENVRSSKDGSEVAAVKAAVRIADKALRATLKVVKLGITENELAGALDFQIRKFGAVNSFDTIAAFGSNASQPHHQPGSRKLRQNDTILIDFGARYKNYCCDLTRCFVIGKANTFYKRAYEAVCKAQAAAIKMVKAGVEIKLVDAAAREVIGRYKLPVYGHSTGHGLGLEVHELPAVSEKSRDRLKVGQVITIEPAVYIAGKLGVRIEDDVLVTKTGCKILSRNCLSNGTIRTYRDRTGGNAV